MPCWTFSSITRSLGLNPARGLPIGNLTSQHFANFYLSGLDHFVCETMRVPAFLRYMDDTLLMANDKQRLWTVAAGDSSLSERTPRPASEPECDPAGPCIRGCPVPGHAHLSGCGSLEPAGMSQVSQACVLRREASHEKGFLDEDTLVRSVASITGHMRHADTRNLRARFFERPGVANRLEPGQTWRQLEQQRQELPVRKSQQEHAGQPNNNLGFRLASSRQRPDVTRSRTCHQSQGPDPSPGPAPAGFSAGRTSPSPHGGK